MTTLTDIRTAGRRAPDGARRRQNRLIAFGLAGDEWDVLVDLAESEGRLPEQQARWVVLQAIRGYAEQRAS